MRHEVNILHFVKECLDPIFIDGSIGLCGMKPRLKSGDALVACIGHIGHNNLRKEETNEDSNQRIAVCGSSG